MTTQTVNVNGPIPPAAGTVPVADGAGNYVSTPLPGLVARNFAGPAVAGNIVDTGTQVSWSAMGVGATPSVNVPITPKSTGRLRVIGAIGTFNASAPNCTILVQLQINGVIQGPAEFRVTIPTAGSDEVDIPFLFEVGGLVVGVLVHVEILLTTLTAGQTASIGTLNSAIDIQEVDIPTG